MSIPPIDLHTPVMARPAGFFGPDFDAAQLARFYDEQGYFVIEDAFSADEVAALRSEALSICRGGHGPLKGLPQIPAEATDADVLREILCIHFPHKISPIVRASLEQEVVVRALVAALGFQNRGTRII